MREIYKFIEKWKKAGKRVALVVVTRTWGSAPRRIGSVMAVNEDGSFAGSVSGGCVESAVIQSALDVIRSDTPLELDFSVPNETAWDVGLACGGDIQILLFPLDRNILAGLSKWIFGKAPVLFSSITKANDDLFGKSFLLIEGELPIGNLPQPLMEILSKYILEIIPNITTGDYLIDLPSGEGINVFVNVLAPPERMIVIGGVDIAVTLTKFAEDLDFSVTLIDPRRKFANRERFPIKGEIVVKFPEDALNQIGIDQSTAIVILSHDPKIDIPALESALSSPAYYIGLLGSSKTQRERMDLLKEKGYSREDLQRIVSPIGLEIGSKTPQEIALAIMAEIIKKKNTRMIYDLNR